MDESFWELVVTSLDGCSDEQLTGLEDVLNLVMTMRRHSPQQLEKWRLKKPDDWVEYARRNRRPLSAESRS